MVFNLQLEKEEIEKLLYLLPEDSDVYKTVQGRVDEWDRRGRW